ncbi:MAG: glycosyltransferase [Gammaproteobacteria bacterium]|nr:glycosyltransferase [Gammaproteobacteria bacterium]
MSTLKQSLPDKIWPGLGTACLISGYVSSDEQLKDITVSNQMGLSASTLLHLATDQIDECCLEDEPARSYLSGFTSLVKFPAVSQNVSISPEIMAEFPDKKSKKLTHGSIELITDNSVALASTSFRRTDDGNRIMICMACWEPDPDRFVRQINSIKAQTLKSWHCIINDDASSDESWLRVQEIIADDSRFSLFRNEENLGFYANFEVALSRVPEDVEYIALADQDDDWYPQKLETCVQAFADKTSLVYCDMRVVDEKGEVIAETYWSGRKNNFIDADVLFLANTVTGAASVFRRELLEAILPFPQPVGQVFHDHWIACVARCQGELAYVDQALYDYYQYGSSVIGHCDFEARGVGQRVAELAGNAKHIRHPGKLKSWLVHKRHSALNVFHQEYLRLFLFAEILKIRVPAMQAEAEKGLRMFSASWLSIFYLLLAHVRIVFRKETTDDAEMRLAASVFIFKIDRIYGRLFANRIVKKHCQSLSNSS